MRGTLRPVFPDYRVRRRKYMKGQAGVCRYYRGSACSLGTCARRKNSCGTTAQSRGRGRVGRVSTGERSGPGRSTDQSSWSGSPGGGRWGNDEEETTRRSARRKRRTERGSGRGWQWVGGSACGSHMGVRRVHVGGQGLWTEPLTGHMGHTRTWWYWWWWWRLCDGAYASRGSGRGCTMELTGQSDIIYQRERGGEEL